MEKEDLRKSVVFTKAKAGNREAFDSLFSQQASALRLFIRYRMGQKVRSAMESVDLVQEVYLGAFKAFDTFRGKTNRDFYNWLCGIANHRISDERRKIEALKRGGGIRFSKTVDSSIGSPIDQAVAYSPGPKTLAALREQGDRMEKTFCELSEKDQLVIGLRQFEALSARESAERIGTNENNVNVLYFRAMKKWRELLEKEQ